MHPNIPLLISVSSGVPAADSEVLEFSRVWLETKEALGRASERMKRHADKRRLDAPTYLPGERVWLSSKYIRLKIPSYKLGPRYIGPFEVLRRTNDVSYKLRLPASLRIPNAFHVSLLKPVILNRFHPTSDSSPLPVSADNIFEVKDILASKKVRDKTFFLIDWKGFGPEERSWEPQENINAPHILKRFLSKRARMLTSGERSVVAAALMFEAARLLEERRPKRKRRMWTRSWLLKRSTLSHMGLIRELRDNNPQDFRNYLRMSEESFKLILAAVTPLIQKRDTPMRAAVPVDERLAVTLRFLATGRSLQDLRFSAAVSRPLLSVLIPETCEAIVQSLRHYMEFPKTADDWKKISCDFEQLWQFPNCGGALDGKHVRITQPANSGSFFYNYKGYFSVILMALVNANYEFVDVDVGMNGRVSDGGVFDHTSFGEALKNNQLQLPRNEDTKGNLNYVFIADEAFPLHPHLLKPFAQRTLTAERRIFNYRLSRARRVVENAFGIMANRFRVFHTAINLKLQSIDFVVLACCVLHNFLRRHDTSSYSPPSFIDSVDPITGDIVPGEWRAQEENLTGLQALGSGRQADDARDCREKYCLYFNGSGAVPWQDRAV
ncbi:uncharacterized protein LOC143810032 [Ranitomeya variabilis]|uniref:uncharacterized protein LOC143810032 n=1 Tax=Ranitomeya variabilis TaxID=490064 RepID=UPI004055B697